MRPVVCVPQGVTFMYEPQVYPAVFPLSAVSAKDVSSVSAGFSAYPPPEADAGVSARSLVQAALPALFWRVYVLWLGKHRKRPDFFEMS